MILDLYDSRHVAKLITQHTDPKVLRILVRLEEALMTEDVEAQVEAVGELSDVLTLEQGMGWEEEP